MLYDDVLMMVQVPKWPMQECFSFQGCFQTCGVFSDSGPFAPYEFVTFGEDWTEPWSGPENWSLALFACTKPSASASGFEAIHSLLFHSACRVTWLVQLDMLLPVSSFVVKESVVLHHFIVCNKNECMELFSRSMVWKEFSYVKSNL